MPGLIWLIAGFSAGVFACRAYQRHTDTTQDGDLYITQEDLDEYRDEMKVMACLDLVAPKIDIIFPEDLIFADHVMEAIEELARKLNEARESDDWEEPVKWN